LEALTDWRGEIALVPQTGAYSATPGSSARPELRNQIKSIAAFVIDDCHID